MNTAPAKMWVFVGERFACIKISGRANFTSSIDFKTVVQELRQKGCNYFVLDLSECALMDSTFLGVLAGFGLKLRALGKPSSDRETIEIAGAILAGHFPAQISSAARPRASAPKDTCSSAEARS